MTYNFVTIFLTSICCAFDRSILSSVTDYLAHNSPCPLIVVKLPKEPTAAEVEAAMHAHDT
jgi:hypothetical protein